MRENETATISLSRKCSWVWLVVAIILGAVAGDGVAQFAYTPVLRLLTRNLTLVVFKPSEGFFLFLRFVAAFSVGGILVGTCAWGATRFIGRFNGAKWAIVFTAAFAVGASVALCFELVMWNSTAPPVIGMGMRLEVPLESVPISTIPITGCLAVFLLMVVLTLVFAKRPRRVPKELDAIERNN